MNAYELADELENKINLSENLFVFNAANMLRQQADQIAELKKLIKRCDPICRPSACDCVKQKPLTDEEIEQCFADACTDFKLLENGKTKGIVNLIDVGRAIEERHGIK